MKWSEFSTARAACAYFFICPGLVYGLLTARLPALKTQTGADDAQIGLILLCLGVSGLAALCGSARLIARWGSRAVLRLGSLALLFSLPFCGLASTPLSLALACVLVGCGTGLADVAMNTQGIQIERRYHAPCMALMHASYSLGGVMGSLAGALFAALGFSPLVNFIGVLGGYACFRPLAVPRLQPDGTTEQTARKRASRALPFFVVGCGLLAMCTYAAEGSVAEWGSLLLFSVKGADEQTAALVYGAFAGTTVLCRIFTDRLRSRAGDFPLTCGGAFSHCPHSVQPRRGISRRHSRRGQRGRLRAGLRRSAVLSAHPGLACAQGRAGQRAAGGARPLLLPGPRDVSAPGRLQERNAGIRAAYGARRPERSAVGR